jgi:hypothetical protein
MVKEAKNIGHRLLAILAHWKITTSQESRNKTTINKFKRDKAINSNVRTESIPIFILDSDSPIKSRVESSNYFKVRVESQYKQLHIH